MRVWGFRVYVWRILCLCSEACVWRLLCRVMAALRWGPRGMVCYSCMCVRAVCVCVCVCVCEDAGLACPVVLAMGQSGGCLAVSLGQSVGVCARICVSAWCVSGPVCGCVCVCARRGVSRTRLWAAGGGGAGGGRGDGGGGGGGGAGGGRWRIWASRRECVWRGGALGRWRCRCRCCELR